MPSLSTSRTRRSRAPSPESQPHSGSDIFSKLAKGILAYSLTHYLTRQVSSSSQKPSSPSDKVQKEMPTNSSSRRDDPTHELISHLVRGAAALAARHWTKSRKKDKDKKTAKQPRAPPVDTRRVPCGRDDFYGGPVPDQPPPGRHHHRRHHRPHRHRPDSRYPHVHYPPAPTPRAELVVALDALSAELGRTTGTIRRLAGRRRPHRHRDGRCDVYEGLRESAGRLEGELERVRAVGNNIRNLREVPLVMSRGGVRDVGSDMKRVEADRRNGSSVRTRPVPEGRPASYVRTRPTDKGQGIHVTSREVPEEMGRDQGEDRKMKTKGGEDRGRRRTRSR